MLPKTAPGEAGSKEPPLPGEGTVICGVIKHLGGDYVLAKCYDGQDRKLRIPGRMRKRVWISEGDIVLAGVWDFSPDRGEVVYKYGRSEVEKLIEKGVISKDFLDAISELI
ncbi:translation initiation factor aIF-1A [Thermogladius sp. 4427co]|uniref:translation initiation factor aIF-1A n=1 Tax=Thermogladius sp. 4427co TaxID=3450718 RepID=UPI003F78C9A7